jgi:hypothetical protein
VNVFEQQQTVNLNILEKPVSGRRPVQISTAAHLMARRTSYLIAVHTGASRQRLRADDGDRQLELRRLPQP